jgi:FMN phosphatase YigB (HAD superfamily)
MSIKGVVFDIGETLVNEERQWFSWADWLGVSRLAFCSALGSVIERGVPHRKVFEMVAPGFDYDKACAERTAAGRDYRIEAADLYPDAIPALRALKDAGYRIGLAGNQPEEAEAALQSLGLCVDFIASSARWGVEKPSPAFFARIVEALGYPASAIAYVGDRLDNDVLPARRMGLHAIFVKRGPWGLIQSRWPEVSEASAVISSLEELPFALQRSEPAKEERS